MFMGKDYLATNSKVAFKRQLLSALMESLWEEFFRIKLCFQVPLCARLRYPFTKVGAR
ncbi:hypothetical protein Echvi_2786 [Echinicola vietnamensis DSM 17526]|uniref:Uncharacterized protein n=1 Tax=Echinicola vietnamensis (strain DSM 17526 / LMG 23754 / KMM 6221) TaxID=926556 RepID=L0G2H2_ECHVK|nr:hypothetical protein Echvi_2786 [Echinicola vietnamensis DSM 17526]